MRIRARKEFVEESEFIYEGAVIEVNKERAQYLVESGRAELMEKVPMRRGEISVWIGMMVTGIGLFGASRHE